MTFVAPLLIASLASAALDEKGGTWIRWHLDLVGRKVVVVRTLV
jgi:hypothetical protein